MNIINAKHFDINAHNSILLVGQTGSGKTYLVRKLVEKYIQTHKPDEIKFAIFDLKQVEFSDFSEDEAKRPYLFFDIQFGDGKSFDMLDKLVELSIERAENNTRKPVIFIYIEECDMACIDQKRFDNAVITINQNAKKANMRLIYSTSSPRVDTVSKELLNSFDLVLIGIFTYTHWFYEYFGIPKMPHLNEYEFAVIERQTNK